MKANSSGSTSSSTSTVSRRQLSLTVLVCVLISIPWISRMIIRMTYAREGVEVSTGLGLGLGFVGNDNGNGNDDSDERSMHNARVGKELIMPRHYDHNSRGLELSTSQSLSIEQEKEEEEVNEKKVQFIQLGSNIDIMAGDGYVSQSGDHTGLAIAINGNGSRIAIGAWMVIRLGSGSGSGSGITQNDADIGGFVRIYEYHESNSSSNNDNDLISASSSSRTNERDIRGDWKQVGSDIHGVLPQDQNGKAIAMSMDGNRIAMGAPASSNYSGSTRIFELQLQNQGHQGKEWTQIGQEIKGDNMDDNSGESVTMSGDGNRVAIGAFRSNFVTGYVKIYQYQSDGNSSSPGQWIQLGNDIVGDGYYDSMGKDLAMNHDGSRIVIGKGLSLIGEVFFVGAVAIYEYNPSSTSWVQLGSDLEGVAYYDIFGESVDINGNGDRIVLGVPNGDEGDGFGLDRGFARVYEYSSNEDEWIQLGNDMIGEFEGNGAGINVSMNMEGTRVVVGSNKVVNGEMGSGGHTRVFDLHTMDAEKPESEWIQIGDYILGHTSAGGTVAMSGDGRHVVTTGGNHAGHVMVYKEVADCTHLFVPEDCTSGTPLPTTQPIISETQDTKDSSAGCRNNLTFMTVLFGAAIAIKLYS